VILACRSISRGEALREEILNEAEQAGRPPPNVDVMELDVSSLASVRRFGVAWSRRGLPLNVLINNAGIFSMSAPRGETADGFESHMGTNHLGHFLLTLLLIPSLRAGAAACRRPSRVVCVSSRLHLMGHFNREDPHLTQGYNSLAGYAQSKLANVVFAAELSRRAGGDILGVALHPGEVTTDVVRSLPGPMQRLYKFVMGFILLKPSEGARCSVYCATSPDLEKPKLAGVTYFDSNCAPGNTCAEGKDPEAATWVWNWSAKEVGLGSEENFLPSTISRKNGRL